MQEQNSYSSTGRLLKRKKPDETDAELLNQKKSLRPRVKNPTLTSGKLAGSKFKSRRCILKRNVQKIRSPEPSIFCVNQTYHNGSLIQIGDIVSLVDYDGGTFFAQIRGLMQDNIGDTCCVLSWLAPKPEYIEDCSKFEPSKFRVALEEDVLRFIESVKFVCSCPSEYFQPIATPHHILSGAYNYHTGTLKSIIDSEIN
ncbi:GATA zinc finger domain-containing protein 1 [Cichlidogyrus casuarinus]|uniref:GATA zinc finger domain-containing protein 1 n=1 Tax=Cichlidogyrus casuarinus TaxID=1844966 RepID=A0ABD2QAD5_9PLAT